MIDKPKRDEVIEAINTLHRWHSDARIKGKRLKANQTKKMYELLKYFEKSTDFAR